MNPFGPGFAPARAGEDGDNLPKGSPVPDPSTTLALAAPGMRTGTSAELPREPMLRAAVAPTGWLAARSARPNWFPLPLLPALDAVGFSAVLSAMVWGLLLTLSLMATAALLSVAMLRGRTSRLTSRSATVRPLRTGPGGCPATPGVRPNL